MPKTILLTGGAGFIAHHVVEYLLNKTDLNIVTLDRLDYSGNLNRLNEVVAAARGLPESNPKSAVPVAGHGIGRTSQNRTPSSRSIARWRSSST